MTVIRLIDDPPQSGDWNMAVDEALLHSAAAGITTLRFYEWSAPTLSLGYFQAYHQRQEHAASEHCSCVRRSSGGGAILHDRELTYSFSTPLAGRKASHWESVYRLFHDSLIGALAEWGIAAEIFQAANADAKCTPPFLCFQRRAAGDVLLGGGKICGSAQRRHRGALLQHGSVLLASSPFAPELPGIAELSGKQPATRELAAAWCTALGASPAFEATFQRQPFNDRELAEQYRRQRFTNPYWLARR